MKIGEAQQIYREQVKEYRMQRSAISKQLKDIRSRMEDFPGRQEEYASEAATLELTLNALDEKETEYQEYLDRLAEQYCAYWNATVADQQADAAAEYAEDVGKMMEVARRIMKGGIVPASDEKKLMEYSFEMYQTAKNIGALARQEKKEKYKSLWKDEEEKEYDDPQEVAENGTAPAGAPDVVEAADTIASVAASG
ncbi:hypothetical protein [Parablautia muri]|uniref:Uncharacterized protein n=1 Tax=Parablautia muri TaxID=2320879 RepID=A0A9X5GRI4_9FIRM|nr:hypothetical protein [Parablautia muri]NBJ92379.1 hypothetical protein [Parablautia muri]